MDWLNYGWLKSLDTSYFRNVFEHTYIWFWFSDLMYSPMKLLVLIFHNVIHFYLNTQYSHESIKSHNNWIFKLKSACTYTVYNSDQILFIISTVHHLTYIILVRQWAGHKVTTRYEMRTPSVVVASTCPVLLPLLELSPSRRCRKQQPGAITAVAPLGLPSQQVRAWDAGTDMQSRTDISRVLGNGNTWAATHIYGHPRCRHPVACSCSVGTPPEPFAVGAGIWHAGSLWLWISWP